MSDKKLYKLDDHILFRKCDLYDGCDTQHGDCTNFKVKQVHCQDNYFCNQEGLHFHCARHPEIEYDNSEDGTELVCPKCGTPVYIGNRHELISRCLKALNRDIFKDATLIRLDDWYIPELKEKRSPSPNYRLTVYIKTDKDEDTIVVLYVSYVGSGNTLLLVASAVGFLKARQSTAGAVLPKEASDIVDAYMEAYAKGNSYSVEYAHFEDEFVRQAYLSVEDQLISYQIEHIEKVNDNLYALTIKMKTTQTVMLRGDVWSEVYNFVARIDGQWKFINGVGNIPDDLQENLEKEKYSYHNENIVDRNDVFELD